MTEDRSTYERRELNGKLLSTISVIQSELHHYGQEMASLRRFMMWATGGAGALCLVLFVGIWNAWGDYSSYRGATVSMIEDLSKRIESNRERIKDMEGNFQYHERNHPPSMPKGLTTDSLGRSRISESD